MKKIILTLLLLLPTQLLAGTDGHGGGGWECEAIGPIELVDFFEARYPTEITRNGLNINEEDTGGFLSHMSRALYRLNELSPELKNLTNTALYDARQILVEALPGTVAPPDDLSNDIIKPGCQLVGIAKYSDRKQRLLMDMLYFERLSAAGQDALWMHEALYKIFRSVPDQSMRVIDSGLARRVTAYLFSDLKIKNFPKADMIRLRNMGLIKDLPFPPRLVRIVVNSIWLDDYNSDSVYCMLMAHRGENEVKRIPVNGDTVINLYDFVELTDQGDKFGQARISVHQVAMKANGCFGRNSDSFSHYEFEFFGEADTPRERPLIPYRKTNFSEPRPGEHPDLFRTGYFEINIVL